MEVDRGNFYQELTNIMEAISSSQAVCIDLEMSGISTKMGEDRVKTSLRDVYAEAKEAAETFTILQMGLTCVSWDEEQSSYITKTYNILLAPSIVGDDQVSNELARKVERQVRFTSQSINFLITNNFDLAKVFERGAPYLSVAEVRQSRMASWVRNEDVACEDHINILELPAETKNFCRLIQSKMQEWHTARIFGEDRAEILTLTSPYGGRLSPLQKRLVHQVINTHFFEYRAHSKQGSTSMEVSRARPTDEKNNSCVLALRAQALMKLTGVRFIWDAITGGTFADKIDAEAIVGQDPEAIIAIRKRLLGYEVRLRKKRPIIVGHNMLHDLCFLFQTFQGKLPDTIREFQELLRKRLVKIVDTKYLFTCGDHEMMPDWSLEECFTAIRADNAVSIRAKSKAFDFKKAMPHQAGYDTQASLKVITREDGGGVAAPSDNHLPRHVSHNPAHGRTATTTTTRSDSLMDDDDDDTDGSKANLALKFEPLKPMTASASSPVVDSDKRVKMDGSEDGEESKCGAKIPEWDDGVFWRRYGNKIRVGVPAMLLNVGF